MNIIKKRILWISPFVPYDSVGHAGGKTENYYVKYIKNSGLFDLHLISCFQSDERGKIDLEKYDISYNLAEIRSDKKSQLIKKLMNVESTLNPFNRTAGLFQNFSMYLLKREILNYAKDCCNNKPEVIILEWTQTILLISFIKNLFPDARIIVIEEDVSFLGYERRKKIAKNFVSKLITEYQYKKLKKIELLALENSDLIVVNNKKDWKILEENGIEGHKLFMIPPYFDDYSHIKHKRKNKDILYFGAMSRKENYLSAIWFIEEVFSKITDKEVHFIVVGSHPAKQLLKYQSDRVKIKGFVEDISGYFEDSLCLVAPLVLGAGIKVKILEALSSGIPVLTNTIGIEGIQAKNKEEYYHCEKSEDYVKVINRLIQHENEEIKITENAKRFMELNYNLEIAAKKFVEKIQEIG